MLGSCLPNVPFHPDATLCPPVFISPNRTCTGAAKEFMDKAQDQANEAAQQLRGQAESLQTAAQGAAARAEGMAGAAAVAAGKLGPRYLQFRPSFQERTDAAKDATGASAPPGFLNPALMKAMARFGKDQRLPVPMLGQGQSVARPSSAGRPSSAARPSSTARPSSATARDDMAVGSEEEGASRPGSHQGGGQDGRPGSRGFAGLAAKFGVGRGQYERVATTEDSARGPSMPTLHEDDRQSGSSFMSKMPSWMSRFPGQVEEQQQPRLQIVNDGYSPQAEEELQRFQPPFVQQQQQPAQAQVFADAGLMEDPTAALKPYKIYTLYSDAEDGLQYPGFMRLLDHLEIKLNRERGWACGCDPFLSWIPDG